jgi:hypothetical protein
MKGRDNVNSTAKTNWKQIGSNVKDVFRSPAFFVPVVISIVLLTVFFLRRFIRWTVKCPSKNDLDGKTVLITGELSCFFVFFVDKDYFTWARENVWMFYRVRVMAFNATFNTISVISLYRGGQCYWWRKPEHPEKKPPTCRKSLDVLYYCLKLANFVLSFFFK